MEIFVSLYRHIYYSYDNRTLMIYDSIRNKVYELIISADKCVFNKELIHILEPNNKTLQFIEKLSLNDMGYITFKQDNRFFLSDYYNRKRQLYVDLLDVQQGDNLIAQNYIKELVISLDSSYDPFFLKEKSGQAKVINYDLLKKYLQRIKHMHIAKVSFIGMSFDPNELIDIITVH